MPLPDQKFDVSTLKLLHYNSFEKPWRHDGVLFGDIFWDHAKKTVFYEELLAMKNRVTPEDTIAEQKAVASLVGNAVRISTVEPVTFKKMLKL